MLCKVARQCAQSTVKKPPIPCRFIHMTPTQQFTSKSKGLDQSQSQVILPYGANAVMPTNLYPIDVNVARFRSEGPDN